MTSSSSAGTGLAEEPRSAGPNATAPSVSAARPTGKMLALRFGGALVFVILDLWSKTAAFAAIERMEEQGLLVPDACAGAHRRYPIFGEWFSFMLSLNPGAAFGKLDSIPWLLVTGRTAAAVFLIVLLWRTRQGRPVFSFALVLVLAGALGNLYDNLLRTRDLALDRYYMDRPFRPVRDFIDVYFGIWDWHFPTFNVADSCISVGAVLLVLTGIVKDKSHDPAA